MGVLASASENAGRLDQKVRDLLDCAVVDAVFKFGVTFFLLCQFPLFLIGRSILLHFLLLIEVFLYLAEVKLV